MKNKSLLFLCGALGACGQPATPVAPPPARTESPFMLTAGVTDIMNYMVDPSADALWDAVSIMVDKHGTVQKQPHTDKEWADARGRATVLAEAANLLMMEGRKVALAGHEVEDAGTYGSLTGAESQAAIEKDRASFIGFAQAMNVVANQMIAAANKKDPEAILDIGAALDDVCEKCHLKFWYPGQSIPPLPEEAKEHGASSAKQPP